MELISLIRTTAFFLLFGLSCYLFLKSFQVVKDAMFGMETRRKRIVFWTASTGLSVSSAFFSAVFFLTSLTDSPFVWSIKNLILSFGLFSILGVVIFLGTLWQLFLIHKFRESIFKKLGKH